MEKLYHVSCSQNHASILGMGLLPYQFISFEERPGPIYLAYKKPSAKIGLMNTTPDMKNRILDDYMLMSAYKHDKCPMFNLYEIDTKNLDPSLFGHTSDKREVHYSGVIPPENIKLLKQYDTSLINEHYLRASKPWWE